MRVGLNGLKSAFNFEKLTVSGTVKQLTESKYRTGSVDSAVPRKNAEVALITVETDSIRFTTDGTDPDSSTGHLVTSGGNIVLESADDIRKFKAIKVANDATIQVSYA